MRKKISIVFILLFLAAACGSSSGTQSQTLTIPSATDNNLPTATSTASSLPAGLAWPINNALSRVTKKTFGLYVSPGHSPISPERFTGYHTGVDFETTPAEQNIDVPIYAICGGKLLLKKWASGYVGVAVESCTINNQSVTIIYGHLREPSISPAIGQQITASQQIAVLGTGYSTETDGERRHLHLGVHKGTAINILGYVQNKTDLTGWLDPLLVLK
jgi:murein DD-endopeptidase MepM/ murein hydrolase activator NlpD